MGKKKIAVLDLSKSDSPKLKASGTRTQKLKKEKEVVAPVAVPVKEVVSKKTTPKEETKVKVKTRVKHPRSKRYQELKQLVDKSHLYPIDAAVTLLRKVSTVKFDATVELHLNLTVSKLTGEVTLPHGTGKTQKIEIASDKTIAKLNDGLIDFDVLVAEPKMMPKLAKYAKLLGPKGLMPNPKNGTISPNPAEAVKKMASGTTHFKSENKAPIVHLVMGKLSFTDKQIEENIKAVLKSILPKNLLSGYICSSMSPSIKVKCKA